MSTETEFTKCPDCQVDVGERHEDGCDVTRCKFTGTQMLMCHFSVSFNAAGGIDITENHDHECVACVWPGEWPGVKVCRENNWYTDVVGLNGTTIHMEDLNSVSQRAVWNPAIEDWEARK